MKFKQPLSKSVSNTTFRKDRRKCHIAEDATMQIRNLSKLDCQVETDVRHSQDHCKDTWKTCSETLRCHPIPESSEINKFRNLSSAPIDVFLNVKDDSTVQRGSNVASERLFETEIFSSKICTVNPNCPNVKNTHFGKSKRNVFKRKLCKSGKKANFLKSLSSLKPSAKHTKNNLSANLKSYIFASMTEIAEVTKCPAKQKVSLEKDPGLKNEDYHYTNELHTRQLKRNDSKRQKLDLDFGKSVTVLAGLKNQNQRLASDSLPSIISKDLTPTCGDIYGVDEVDNVTFEKYVRNGDLEQVHSLHNCDSIYRENGTKQLKVTEGEIKEALLGAPQTFIECGTEISENSGSEKREDIDIAQVDRYSGKSAAELAIKGELTSGRILNKNFYSSSNVTSLSHSQIQSSNVHGPCENPWVLQDCLDKSVQKSFRLPNVEIESSLGFEVNYSHDTEKPEFKHSALTRSESTDSVDSFGSSYHSVSSVKDLYFSDSEAEHNIDEMEQSPNNIVDMNAKISENSSKFVNKVPSEMTSDQLNKSEDTTGIFHEDACGTDKIHFSDSDSDQKQMIPYTLSENFSGNITVRKKKKLHSKSEEKLDKSWAESPGEKKSKLIKSLSHGFSGEDESKHREIPKHYRRSLDSSLAHRNILNELKSPEKRQSAIHSSTEFLSPVLESEVKTSKTNKTDIGHSDNDVDATRFFTLPNPKKLKAQQSNLRKRLGSVSKLISDKAQSLSNLKMGASFKLRKELEKSKVLVSSSATSLSGLMTKKASSFSTLVRRRTNSNTALESPFKQYTKKRCKVKEENKTELAYEKVIVKVPVKRPVTSLETTARSKRLRVNLRLAKNAAKSKSESSDYETRSRTDSYLGRPWSSGSLSPVRSPTLLDEIMKCVDTDRVRQQCSLTNDDLDQSDCEDSSSGSSLFLFQKQYSLESENKDTTYMSVCRGCGKMRNSSDRSSDSTDSLIMKKQSGSYGLSLSLCDLNATCQCYKNSQKVKHRFSLILSSQEFMNWKSLMSNNRRSWDIIPNVKGVYPEDLVSPKDIKRGNIFMKRGLFSATTQRPSSMFDLRNDLDETNENVEFEMGEAESKDNVGSADVLPGTLLRHRPVLDLSGENLDETGDSEDGVIDDRKDAYTRRSQSCGDLIDSENYLESKITETALVKKVKVKNENEEDTESYHSCSETVETDTDVIDLDSELENENLRFNSCGNLLEAKEVRLGDKLKQEEQKKRELRKVKVKSMSSSHDALSALVPMETIHIDDLSAGTYKKDNTDLENDRKVAENGQSLVNDIIEFAQNGKGIDHTNSSGNVGSVISISDGNKTNRTQLPDKGEENENIFCEKCKCLRSYSKYVTKNGLRSYELDCKPLRKFLPKPPVLRNKKRTKVMSLSDISNHDLKDNQELRKQKGFSMFELDKENINGNFCKCDLWVKGNKLLYKGKYSLNRSESSSTPKSASLKRPSGRFLFDDQQVQRYIKTVSKLDRQISMSSDNVNTDSQRQSNSEKLFSASSLHCLSKDSWSDEVFNRLSYPLGAPFSPYLEFFESTPVERRSRFSGSTIPSAGLLPELPELPSMTEECVYKYDVCLGYLLHSVQCDNKMICVYSLQRNKQLMESVITPLTATPQTPNKKSQEHGSVNKNKAQHKPKIDDLPNPAAPITSVPSDRLAHAGLVLRTVLLARAPHMIRDRKFHLRTYRRCMVGTEMVDWLLQQSAIVHSRTQAVGMWQALVEEGVVVHVCHEHQFKDKYLFYRFHDDDEGVSTVPSSATKRECEEDLQDVFLLLAHIGPDAMMRMILRKPPHERAAEDLEIIYEELLHIKALSHLSTMVKRELASVLLFESHDKSGTVLFNQGDEGKSWYIILKGSVNVVIYGKGVVCTLHEGDDFGKLALVNDAPRAATIVLRDDNCHFLRVDKEDFNRILRDVEANTVRLKEHGQDVLVLEKIPSNTQTADGSVQAHYKYSVMAGTPEKMLEHLLDSRIDNKNETEIDGFLEDFLLTHVIFIPCNHLCPVLLSHYHSSSADSTEQEGFEFMLNHKKCVLHFVQEWSNIVGVAFKEDHTINAFLEELHSCVHDDIQDYPALKNDLAVLKGIINANSGSPNSKLKKRASGTFTLSRKHSKECFQDLPKKRKPVSPSEEAIFKVYCADHTYSTLKLPRDTKVETLLLSTKEKLGLGDDLILCEVKSTGERLIFKESDLCVTTGLSINGRLFVTPKEHLDALTPLPEQEGPSDGSFSTIEMYSSREMAYHMTLYDWELFTCVQEYELIYQVFGRYKFGKITANLDLFLRRFNEIQFWVVTEMVLTCNLSKRVSLLRKFIKLAAHCKEFKNLNGFFSIVMGLSNIAVSRLSQTWEKLPSKFKKMFEDFETLMDPSRNHRVYRLSVSKMVPPILPFMPLLMKDMTFTHEGNKTYFDGLVNFEKMHMIAQTLKTVRFCRSARLEIDAPGTLKSSDTSDYIRNLKVIDNQRLLTQLSHKLEPRKT